MGSWANSTSQWPTVANGVLSFGRFPMSLGSGLPQLSPGGPKGPHQVRAVGSLWVGAPVDVGGGPPCC